MDYKDKYENALKWARGIYPKAAGAFKEDLEHIFPEFAESEDERIRKTLLDHFKQNRDEGDYDERWNGLSYDSIITWLEKQGSTILSNSSNIGKDKQKPAWSEEDEQGYEDVDWCINKALHACNNEDEAGTCWFAQRWINSIKLRLGGK